MATATSRSRQLQSLTWILWREAFFEWGVPLLLGGAIGLVAILGGIGFIDTNASILSLGWLALLLLLFFLLRTIIPALKAVQARLWIMIFSCFWIAITATQFYFSVFVGRQVFSGTVPSGGKSVSFSLGPLGTEYDVIIEGSFNAAEGEVEREAQYDLTLERNEQQLQEFTGTLFEHWGRQRLGRRGSTKVRQLHNHTLHRFASPGEGTYTIGAVRMDPQLVPTLKFTLYRDLYPQKTFWLLNFLLLLGAYLLERVTDTREQSLLLGTAAALAFVLLFRQFGAPPHSYQNLIGAAMLAALFGPIGGWLFRVAADAGWKACGLPKREVLLATGKKGQEKKR